LRFKPKVTLSRLGALTPDMDMFAWDPRLELEILESWFDETIVDAVPDRVSWGIVDTVPPIAVEAKLEGTALVEFK
jgi:hypothetical protein